MPRQDKGLVYTPVAGILESVYLPKGFSHFVVILELHRIWILKYLLIIRTYYVEITFWWSSSVVSISIKYISYKVLDTLKLYTIFLYFLIATKYCNMILAFFTNTLDPSDFKPVFSVYFWGHFVYWQYY